MLGEACRGHDFCHLHLILLLCLVHSLLVFSVCYLRHPSTHTNKTCFCMGPTFTFVPVFLQQLQASGSHGLGTTHTYTELVFALVFDHVLWVQSVWPVRNMEHIILGPSIRAEGYEIKKKRPNKNKTFLTKVEFQKPEMQTSLTSRGFYWAARMWLWPWWLWVTVTDTTLWRRGHFGLRFQR